MEDFIKVPIPDFNFSDYIIQKAKRFGEYKFREGSRTSEKDISDLESEIYQLSEKDQIQYIAQTINLVTEGLAKHKERCKKDPCMIVDNTRDVLYYLYKKLEEEGIDIKTDSFSEDETNNNNSVINRILNSLEELKQKPDASYSEKELFLIDQAKMGFERAKGLQFLGKHSWFIYLAGIVFEFGSNKFLEEFFNQTIMPLINGLGYAAQYLIT